MFHQISGNPFEEEPLPKAYYFPSLEKRLSPSQKKICLSPNKEDDHSKQTSKADAKFLRESNKLEIPTREDGTVQHEVSSGSQFDESWPSTDRNVSTLSHNTPSSSSTPAENENKTDPPGSVKISLGDLHEDKLSRPSTLSKYVERFRHGVPTSRQDRSLPSSGKDFWWLTPPSNTSTPKDPSDSTTSKFTLTSESSSKVRRNATATSPPRQKYGFKRNQFSRPVRETVEGMDTKSTDLLARTNQLLEKSENTLSDVSSSESIPKPPSSWMIEKQKRLDNAADSRTPVAKPRVAPEDDILYQWRLSRRLEQAQEEVKGSHVKHFVNTATHRAASLTRGRYNAYLPEQDYPRYHIHSEYGKDDNTSSVMHEPESAHCRERNSLRNRKVALERNAPAVCFIDEEKVPSHVHMLCDIVPCSKQIELEKRDVSVKTHCPSTSDFCKHTIESGQKPRPICDSPDIQDRGFQERSVIGDIAERSRPRVLRNAACHPESTVKEKQRKQSDNHPYLHDKEKMIPNSKQQHMSHLETAESDSIRRTTTTLENNKNDQNKLQFIMENEAMKDLLDTDERPKTIEESESKSNSRKNVGDNDPTNLGMTSAFVSRISHGRTDRDNSGDQLADMQNTGVIGTVIGQVISERLFSSTPSSRRSSLGSSSALTESGGVEHQKEKNTVLTSTEGEQEHTTATPDNLLFPDDDILIRLRYQADFYREHLRNIDGILKDLTE